VIERREIIDVATRQGLNPHIVEKDFVLGWLLAAITSFTDCGGVAAGPPFFSEGWGRPSSQKAVSLLLSARPSKFHRLETAFAMRFNEEPHLFDGLPHFGGFRRANRSIAPAPRLCPSSEFLGQTVA
jgi:hypothetical protein